MTKAEELIQAAKLIKQHCENKKECGACPLWNYKRGGCSVGECRLPEYWKIPSPRRFTNTDILWAKAAKAAGATVIKKEACLAYDCGVTFAYTDIEKTSEGTVTFPTSAFSSIQPGESVPIDEILKEEEV